MSLPSSIPSGENGKGHSPQGFENPSPSHVKPRTKATNGRTLLDVPLEPSLRPSLDSFSDFSTYSLDYHSDSERRAAQPLIHGEARLHSRSPGPRKTWKHSVEEWWARNKGLVLVIFAQLFGALMSVTTRLLETDGSHGTGMHPFQILFVRMSITLLLSFIYLYWAGVPDAPFGKKEVRGLLVARGLGGFFGAYGFYYSLRYLPIAEATVITFLAPGVACAACWILIKEPFTRSQQLGALVSLLGVVLIARPTSLLPGRSVDSAPAAARILDGVPSTNSSSAGHSSYPDEVKPSQRLAAVGLGLIGVCGAACAYTTIRWIGKRAHPLISVTYFAAWCTIVSVAAVLSISTIQFRLPSNPEEWGYLIFLGICGFLMQFLLTAGLAHEKSSRATNMVYTQVIFALAADKLVFDTTPDGWSIVGSSLVLGSALYIAVHRETSKAKNVGPEGGEEEVALITGDGEEESARSGERMRGVEEVQLRTMRA